MTLEVGKRNNIFFKFFFLQKSISNKIKFQVVFVVDS